MALGFAVTFYAVVVVNLALPSIGDEFGGELAGLQWITSAYLLALAALLLPGGSAGDLLGRRRIFLVGAGVFATGSVGCALGPSLSLLVAARLVQGAGAALMVPAVLAMIDTSFVPADRGRAIAVWTSGSAAASAVCPLLGGWVVDAVHWRWMFLVPVPLVAVAAWVTVRYVPQSRDDNLGRHLDLPSAALALVAASGIVFALVQGPSWGFVHPGVAAAGVIGAAGVVALVFAQRRNDPMIPSRLFRSRQFSGANLLTLLVEGAIGAAFFFTAIQFQRLLGYSALAAGAALVPMQLVMFVLSPGAGTFANRFGPRWLITAGPLVVAAGMVTLALVGDGARYALHVLPGVLLLGLGMATLVGPVVASVFAAVGEEDVGIAAAMNNTLARTGALLAVSFLPYAAGMTGNAGAAVLSAGYQRAMLMAAGVCVLAAVIGCVTVGRCVPLFTSRPAIPAMVCGMQSLPTEVPDALEA
jgi:EmrB/QacA subfamily drug resistance transporter